MDALLSYGAMPFLSGVDYLSAGSLSLRTDSADFSLPSNPQGVGTEKRHAVKGIRKNNKKQKPPLHGAAAEVHTQMCTFRAMFGGWDGTSEQVTDHHDP